jgi:DNA-binding NarL/FixJ family response regulator
MATAKDRRSGARPASVSGPSEKLNRQEAVRLWRDMTSGRIGIKRYHDERGRRFLVLKPRSKAAQVEDLSERERRAMGYRAFGQGFRQIADELGVAVATVMADVARARKGLGLASDLELPAILAAGPRKVTATRRGSRSSARPSSSKLRRRQVWHQALRAPRGLRREPSRKATEPLVISFPISDVDWRRGLSPAEVSVVEAMLAGEGRPQIAARRGTAMRTIVNQIASAFRKLDVSSRLELSFYILTGRHAVERRRK